MKIDCYLFKCGIEASSKMFFKLYCALQFREGIFLRYPNSKIALSLSFPSSENPKLFNPDIIWEETKERDGLWLKKAAPFAWYFNLTFSFSLFSWETIAVGLFNNSAQVCSMWFFLNLNRVTKACLSRKSQMTEIQLFTSLRPLSW